MPIDLAEAKDTKLKALANKAGDNPPRLTLIQLKPWRHIHNTSFSS